MPDGFDLALHLFVQGDRAFELLFLLRKLLPEGDLFRAVGYALFLALLCRDGGVLEAAAI